MWLRLGELGLILGNMFSEVLNVSFYVDNLFSAVDWMCMALLGTNHHMVDKVYLMLYKMTGKRGVDWSASEKLKLRHYCSEKALFPMI